MSRWDTGETRARAAVAVVAGLCRENREAAEKDCATEIDHTLQKDLPIFNNYFSPKVVKSEFPTNFNYLCSLFPIFL